MTGKPPLPRGATGPPGSYLERVIADSIVRDLVPALIHAARRKPQPLGFGGDVELASDTEVAVTDDTE